MDQFISSRKGPDFDAGFKSLAGFALDLAQDQIVWVDSTGRFAYVNRSACLAYEYSREELLSMTVSDICPDLTPPAWAEHWQELKAAGQMVLEVRQRSRSGKYTLVEISTTYMQHEGQEYSCAFGRDISGRKRVEQDLTEAKQKLEAIFETMQAGIILVNQQGLITFANRRMAAMFGWPLDELIGSGYSEHLHPDQRDVGEGHMLRLIAGQIDHVHDERHFIRRPGSDFWGHLSGRRLEDEQGRLVSLVGVIADISEMKRAEETLKKREQQFTSLADNLPDVVSRLDRAHRHLYVNRQVEAISGIPVSDYLGKTNRELGMPPELLEQWESAVSRAFDSGEIVKIRFAFQAGSGIRHYESRIVPERGEDGAAETVLCIARDITEAVLAEQQLMESEERYRTIIENMQDIYYRADAEGRLTMVSPSGAATLGYDSVEQILGLSVRDALYFDPEERDAFLHNLRLKRELSGYELTLKRKNGTPLPVATSSHLLFAPDGAYMGVEGVFRDISQYQQAMEQLRASEDKFSKAFSHAPLLMSISDIRTGRYLEVNNRFCEVSGFSRQEALGRTSVELGWLPAADRERLMEILQRDGRVQDFELQLTAKDGSPVLCLYSAEIINLDGSDRLLSIALDITQRKKDLEDLDYAKQCFTQALNGGQHILYRLNVKKGGYDYLSPVFEWITGYAVADFSKINLKELSEYFHPDDRQRVLDQIDSAIRLRTGQNVNFDLEYRFRKADGSYCWFHDTTTAVFSEEDKLECFFGSVHDISALKRAEEKVRQQMLLLQQEQEKNQRLESLGFLAGGIAHDFNNILTGIVGNLSLARMMIDGGHRAANRLEECEKAAKRASELTQQLLTFARGGEPVKKVVNISRLLNEAVSFALRGSNVKAELAFADDLWSIDADEGQINQALNNLLINAVQAMPDGGTVTVRGENCISDDPSQPLGRYVRLTVKDTGVGIPSDLLSKIFDPYFTTKKFGTGLGLASVYSIVTRHGGTVTVSSQPGGGAEFEVCLPAVADLPAAEADRHDNAGVDAVSGRRVLVMDDEELIRDVVSMMLSEIGCLPELCSEGDRAVELYRAALEKGTPYDVVILDLTVPGGMGGLEAARRIMLMDGNARLLVSSGYSNDAVVADLSRHGFCGSVMKPYSIKNLSDELGRVLGKS